MKGRRQSIVPEIGIIVPPCQQKVAAHIDLEWNKTKQKAGATRNDLGGVDFVSLTTRVTSRHVTRQNTTTHFLVKQDMLLFREYDYSNIVRVTNTRCLVAPHTHQLPHTHTHTHPEWQDGHGCGKVNKNDHTSLVRSLVVYTTVVNPSTHTSQPHNPHWCFTELSIILHPGTVIHFHYGGKIKRSRPGLFPPKCNRVGTVRSSVSSHWPPTALHTCSTGYWSPSVTPILCLIATTSNCSCDCTVQYYGTIRS